VQCAMNDQEIPKVSLARLVRYTTRNCYKELQKLVENCLEEESATAKASLYEFLLSERYRFTRLLVLLKWYSRYGRAHEYCEEKIAESRGLLASYESSADGLWTVHNKLSDACLPLIPIQSATEILATGGYGRLPSILYRNFVNKEYLLGLDGGKEATDVLKNSDWLGLVSRTLLLSSVSKNPNLRLYYDKTGQWEHALEVGSSLGAWSLVLMATAKDNQIVGWKVLQVRIFIKGVFQEAVTDRQNNQMEQSVLSREQELYLSGICQQIFDQHSSSEESKSAISQAVLESGRFLEEKICIPLAMDILRLQALRLSKNPLFVFKLQKDKDAVYLKFWQDPLSNSTEMRISPLTKDGQVENLKDQNRSQQLFEYPNGSCLLVVRHWPFCIHMSLVDTKHRADSSKDSFLRQVVLNPKSGKVSPKTISESLLDISIQKISFESIVVHLLSFKCRYLLERLKEELTSRKELANRKKKISLEYENGVHVAENQFSVAYLLVPIIGNIVVRMHVSLISGKLCAYTTDEYAWLKDKRCSTGYTEFSPMDYSGIVQFIIDHEKCIIRTATYCQLKALSLVIRDDYFASRVSDEKLMNALWDKYTISCYADLDTCIALSPLNWFGTTKTSSTESERYEFYCAPLTAYNLFFVYHKKFDSEWLLTHCLNASLGARWLAVIETRKRQQELDTILEESPLESNLRQCFKSIPTDNCHNGFFYVVEENTMRNVRLLTAFSLPVERGIVYTSSWSVRRVWFDYSFSFLDQSQDLGWRRLLSRFSSVQWSDNEGGIRLWHFGGQNLKASLILTYAHGHICVKRLVGDIVIAQHISKLVRSISANPHLGVELVWKNWRELVVVNKPLHDFLPRTSASPHHRMPYIYIRLDLRRHHTFRNYEDMKEEGRTSKESKWKRRYSYLLKEALFPTLEIFPSSSPTKQLCEVAEQVLFRSFGDICHYSDVLLDHICFLVECFLLLGSRFQISVSNLFRIEVSHLVSREKERALFCAIEISFEQSPKAILIKNLGHFTQSFQMGPDSNTRNKVR